MENQVSVSSPTVQAHVAVLEDHDETANCICQELERDGKIVEVASTLDKFEALVKNEDKFDVCSVDWKIGKWSVGATALSLINRYERDAGKVVYSVYVNQPHIRREVEDSGADFILGKVGENYDDYRVEVEKGARLGLSRQIRRKLAELGHSLKEDFSPDSEEETRLMRQARSLGLESASAGKNDDLIVLLKRRGWWLSLNLAAYSNLPTWEKLTSLFNYVHAQEDDIARMLECGEAEVQKLLNDKVVPPTLENAGDEMLSILAYLLRLSKYEPELMPHYWNVVNLFSGSLSSPPWDTFGLHQYLKASGLKGIETALDWIRSH